MKIAIISLPLSYNYGGYLQCYALMEVLRGIGHEPIFLQRENGEKPSPKKNIVNCIKDIFEQIGLSIIVDKFEIVTNSGLYYKTRNFRQFTKRYIKSVSPVLRTTPDVISFCKKKHITAYITGSDQIWRAAYLRSLNDAFLGFAPQKSIKISYAPSFGTDVWEYDSKETLMIRDFLSDFKAISVRENDGVDMLKNFVSDKLNPVLVLDPTFLLHKSQYLFIAKEQEKRCGILTYILNSDEKKTEVINLMCKELNISSFSVINAKTNTREINGAQGFSVEQWIAGFRDADYVVTDSFHAIVFSIIFNKSFWVFENENRGNSRIINILKLFGCEDRFIDKNMDMKHFDWKQEIDWDVVNAIKDNMKETSLKFLTNALSV